MKLYRFVSVTLQVNSGFPSESISKPGPKLHPSGPPLFELEEELKGGVGLASPT